MRLLKTAAQRGRQEPSKLRSLVPKLSPATLSSVFGMGLLIHLGHQVYQDEPCDDEAEAINLPRPRTSTD